MSYQTETGGGDPAATEAGAATPGAPAAPEYNEKMAKKNLSFAFFIILCIIAGIAGFAAFLNFCVSMSQVSSQTELANGTSIFEKGGSCSDFKRFWPVRWEFQAEPSVMMKCPWPTGNSGIRSLMDIISMGSIALFVFVLLKPKLRWLNWAFFGVIGFITLMFFIMIIVDGAALSKGNDFCKKGMPEAAAHFRPELKVDEHSFGIECASGPFTGLVFCDVFVFLSFPALAAYFFFYHRRAHRHGESQIPNRDDERQPLAAPPKKKKMFVASTIQDESLTQDVTGENPFDPKTGMVDPNSSGVF